MTRSTGYGSDPGIGCGSLIALVVIALALALLQGCGASAITAGARGVDAAGTLLRPAMDMTRSVRGAELDACDQESDVEACLDARELAWAPRIAALNAARDALEMVLDGLDAAHAHAEGAPSAALLMRLASIALDAWEAAARAGVAMPALPVEVRGLIGGEQ